MEMAIAVYELSQKCMEQSHSRYSVLEDLSLTLPSSKSLHPILILLHVSEA